MLDQLFINQYLVDPSKQPKHKYYAQSVEIKKSLAAHSKGTYPKDLIEIVRPNETFDQKQYRKSVWTPKTKTYFSKVVTTLAKIQRAEDWKISFPDSTIAFEKANSLEDYTQKNYPYFGSLENWFFSVQMRDMCDDPNGVIAVLPMPKIDPMDDSEVLNPFTFWFGSECVIDYVENSYCVLKSTETSTLIDKNQNKSQGSIYYIIDKDSWAICTQVGDPKNFTFTTEISVHNIGSMPAFKIGGIIEEFSNGQKLWDSFLGDCLPDWDEALRRYSDLQVQMVLHVHSEKWEIEDSPCKVCNETGTVNKLGTGGNPTAAKIACGNCGGTGSVSSRSPFNVKTIKPARQIGLGDSVPIATPPMGYIQKPIDDTKFIDQKVNDSIESGLAAINMEYLMFEPEENSGVAKTLDRQEVNTFFYEVGRHIVKNIENPCYYFIAKWKYGVQLNDEQVKSVVPQINVPTKFDILTEDILSARLAAANTSNIDPSLKMALQIEWAKREFGDGSDQVAFIKCVAELDPLPAKTDEEKMTILSNKGTTNENYILSCNLTPFIIRAESENDDFYELEYADKMKILMEYVSEITDSQDAAKVQIVPIQPNPNAPVIDPAKPPQPVNA